MSESWVNLTSGVPIIADFKSTAGQGTPVCIDRTTGLGYYLGQGDRIQQLSTYLTPESFGAVGDNVTDDGPAFTLALAYLKTLRVAGFGYGRGSPRLFIPAKAYYLGSTTLDISDFSPKIEGEGNGLPGGAASILRWAANTTGIRVQFGDTEGATGVRASSGIEATPTIRGLFLQGGYSHGTTAEGEFHGIHLRSKAIIEDCWIDGFQGDGIYTYANTLAPAVLGNANLSTFNRVSAQNCRNGFYFLGADSNACTGLHCNALYNRQWGFLDSSFLGNEFFGCHASTNGLVDSSGASVIPPNRVTFAGNIYAVKFGQEAWCSANAPSGTTADNTGWLYQRPGGASPSINIRAWAGGTTYRSAGAYAATDLNNRSIFYGYAEGDQGPSQMFGRGRIEGFHEENGTRGLCTYTSIDGYHIKGSYLTTEDGFILKGPAGYMGDIGSDTIAGQVIRYRTKSGAGGGGFQLFWDGANVGDLLYDNNVTYVMGGKGFGGWTWLGGGGTYSVRIDASGINLEAAKTIRINGTQVITARQTGTAANATDLATAITLVNDLKAKLITHGLIS